MDERSRTPATWFSEHSGLLLFVVGSVMVLIALIAVLLLDRSAATTVAILFIGAGMILVGALLPRIAGTIKITPGSIEMAIAERLEATRQEAAKRAPGREDEAVARAMHALATQLPVATRDAATPAADASPATSRRPGMARGGQPSDDQTTQQTQPGAVKPVQHTTRRPARQAQAPSQPLRPSDRICGACGEGNDPARKYCRACGSSLADAETAARPPWWKRTFRRESKAHETGTRPTRRGRGPQPATAPPATPAGNPPQSAAWSTRAWRIAAATASIAAIAVTVILVTTLTLGGEPSDPVNTPTADGSDEPTSTDEPTPTPTPTADPNTPATSARDVAIGAVSIVVVATILFWLGWRTTRTAQPRDDHVARMDEPQEFARRIVDDL